MKKKLKSLLTIMFILLFTTLIIINPEKINNTILLSCNIFIKNIIPSLFPMYIIANMLIDIKIPKFLSNIFNNTFYKLFKVSGEASFIFFISILTGAPSNAKYINDLLETKNISINTAQKILLFSSFINPLFIINTTGTIFLNNTKIGIYLFLSHILSNILTGITLRNYKKDIKINQYTSLKDNLKDLNHNINNNNLFKTILTSIKNSIDPLLTIFSTLTFFLILINILNLNNNNIISILLSGILEMTTGLKMLSTSLINYNLKIYISMFFISFGGLSIHAQIFNMLNKKKINYLPFFISKIINSIYSIIIIYFTLQLNALF